MSIQILSKRYEFRKIRTRKKIFGVAAKPRLSVYRSSKHIYAQLVDDEKGTTLVSASTLTPDLRASAKTGATIEAAKAVGKLIAEKALKADIKQVVFDRGGHPYHGRIKAVADGAREAGLKF
ncbi:MAG: 50S ribosomal protein L18 [Elusimicrobia bacterium]|nr:50S ribosomal protein L18 [Elusimicrobiota bacterium]